MRVDTEAYKKGECMVCHRYYEENKASGNCMATKGDIYRCAAAKIAETMRITFDQEEQEEGDHGRPQQRVQRMHIDQKSNAGNKVP